MNHQAIKQKRVFTQTFGVVGAIIEREDRILLVKENTGTGKGKWNQPAGWIDVGEHPIDSVIREVKEETGLDFAPTGLLGIYSIVKTHRKQGASLPHGIKLIFRGTISGATMHPNEEVAELAWFTRDEIEAMTSETLRDADIKQELADYFSGTSYSLEIIHHTLGEEA